MYLLYENVASRLSLADELLEEQKRDRARENFVLASSALLRFIQKVPVMKWLRPFLMILDQAHPDW